jgi:3-deoxy-manno-octulosonate cytidylyltransferase (CMP-KDO synthetase)
MKRIIALIPARYNSSRFPGKLMQDLGGKTVILNTYLSTLETGLFDHVAVVTDSEYIYQEIRNHGGDALMSKEEHCSGTDRIAEAVLHFPEAEIIVNVQGDEPFNKREPLELLLNLFTDEQVMVGSLMQEMSNMEAVHDPNNVKVVVDKWNRALLFSRSVIPYIRDNESNYVHYKHIGVYAFRREMLLQFSKLSEGRLESIEKLEGLRYLENGIPVNMVLCNYENIGIDSKEDLIKARLLYNMSLKDNK